MIRNALLAALLAAIAGGWLGYEKGDTDRFNAMSADWNAQQLRQAREFSEQLAERNKDIEALRASEREKDATYERNQADAQRRADVLAADLVRQRAARPAAGASVPATPGPIAAAEGCTGAQLYRDDAVFLVREAERAEGLRNALYRCQGGDAEPVSEGGKGDH